MINRNEAAVTCTGTNTTNLRYPLSAVVLIEGRHPGEQTKSDENEVLDKMNVSNIWLCDAQMITVHCL